MTAGTVVKTRSVASWSNRPRDRGAALTTPRRAISGADRAADCRAASRASANALAAGGRISDTMLVAPSTTVESAVRMSLLG